MAVHTSVTDAEQWWATSITEIRQNEIHLRGYAVEDLILNATYPGVIWLLLRGELPTAAQERLFGAALLAAVDHGPQAPSIAAGRMAATCGVGLNGALAAGVGMLGAVHGGAGEQCMELLAEIRAEAQAGGDHRRAARAALNRLRAAGWRVPGFGHRFHTRDPRRDPLLGLVRAAVDAGAVDGSFLAVGTALEEELAERGVPMNIDGVTAVVYSELGFAPPLGRGLFCLSRSVGILAHAWEELAAGSRLKGPLPPSYLAPYTGVHRRRIDPPAATTE